MKNFDENCLEYFLRTLADNQQILIPDNFSASVMSRIKNDSNQKVIYFEKLFIRYSLAASAVAAACLLLAVNLFTSYTPSNAEYAAIDYFNLANF